MLDKEVKNLEDAKLRMRNFIKEKVKKFYDEYYVHGEVVINRNRKETKNDRQ